MQAGASMKGEFEQRLRSVIDEVQASPTPIILFIDEAHTLIGAGGQAGTGDAANLLKPALARGTLRTIAATTWSEYRQYIEKDPALTRRFQPVQWASPASSSAATCCGASSPPWRSTTGEDLGRRHRAGGEALPPLHPGPPAPRQGREPSRHRLRPGRHLAERHARGHRGRPVAIQARETERAALRPTGTSGATDERRLLRSTGSSRASPRSSRRSRPSGRPSRRWWARSAPCARCSPPGGGLRPGGGPRGAPGEVRRARGAGRRQAHDLRPRGRAGGGLGRLRLDRHPGRPDDEGRGGDGAGPPPRSSIAGWSASPTACG
jgi:hypothetical protein